MTNMQSILSKYLLKAFKYIFEKKYTNICVYIHTHTHTHTHIHIYIPEVVISSVTISHTTQSVVVYTQQVGLAA